MRSAARQRGSVATWVVLSMPLFVGLLGFVFDLAWLSAGRQYLQVAADNAALAGVLEVDLDQLAGGNRRLLPERAFQYALQCARQNLRLSLTPQHAETSVVTIRVYQPGEPGQHGEHLEPGAPSVCVRIELAVQLPVSRMARVIAVHADASIVGRPE